LLLCDGDVVLYYTELRTACTETIIGCLIVSAAYCRSEWLHSSDGVSSMSRCCCRPSWLWLLAANSLCRMLGSSESFYFVFIYFIIISYTGYTKKVFKKELKLKVTSHVQQIHSNKQLTSSKSSCVNPWEELASVALLVASRYAPPGYADRRVWSRGPGWLNHCVRLSGLKRQVGSNKRKIQIKYKIAASALRLNSRAATEGSTVSSLICDCWLILGSETLSISRCLNHW